MIFSEFQIGELKLVNRLARSATAERGADETGRVTNELLAMMKILAEGGVGSIMTGHAFVHPNGRTNFAMTGIHIDDMIPGLSKLAQVVHRNSDAKIFAQINHAGRVTSEALIGAIPAGPSAVPVRLSKERVRELSSDEIEELVEVYVSAALRAQEAGFDGVQLHCAHGYLISQFLSGYTNRREDRWGGSSGNRRRFLMTVIDEIQARAPGLPLTVKINCEDFVTGGVNIEEFTETCRQLQGKGISAIEVSGGIPESGSKAVTKGVKPGKKEGYFVHGAKALKEAGISVPVIAVGGFRSKSFGLDLLDQGFADIIALSRPLITEPDLPNKWEKGDSDESRCISCNKCLLVRKGMTHCVYWTQLAESDDSKRASLNTIPKN